MPTNNKYTNLHSELDPAKLMDAACTTAKLTNYGDLRFIAPMTKLIEASIREINFSEAGLMGFKADINRILINKLRMHADLLKHPEIFDEDVSDPIVIVGLVRTGTTKLQRLIARDPGVQSIPLWQLLYPSRFPDTSPGNADPRQSFAMAAGGFAPGPAAEAMQAGHPMILNAADEDILLFENTFEHLYLYLRNYTPSYLDWLNGRAAKEPYEYYKTILQYLQWQNGGRQGRPWVLKCTTHISELETFFATFPNATMVHCHRDPCEVIPSYSRLQELSWTLRGDPGDPRAIGKSMLNIWSRQINANLNSRRRANGQFKIIDVAYEQIKDNPFSVIEEIYSAAKQPLTPDAISAMQEWERNNEQHKFGRHTYSSEYFGLSDVAINAAFHEYIEQFDDKIY